MTLGFLDSLRKLVLVKDLETSQDFSSVYKVGKVVRATKNKLERLTLKQSVIYHQDGDAKREQGDKETQILGLYSQVKGQHAFHKVQAGDRVKAEISLVKDYGNIVGVEKFPSLTGFVLSEHLNPKKEYKEGQEISCVVLDIDFEKEILDLSERLAEAKPAPAQVKVGHQYRVTVELNKEDYLLVSFKQSRTCIGLLMTQSFNDD